MKFSSATISAPPTTNNASGSTVAPMPEMSKPPPIISSGGATSKIMHPPEDLSLEEVRARKPKYLKQITIARANALNFASSNTHHQHNQINSSPAQQTHEVSKSILFCVVLGYLRENVAVILQKWL